MPAPPYQLVDDPDAWLDQTDLVFIRPGRHRPRPRCSSANRPKRTLGLHDDIASVGEFIRLYLGRYQRWSSPLFMVGESYGTTRAAGLSGYLVEHGVAFNGIMLISSILNFETTDFAPGNDLPYVVSLPSYATSAWYHKKLGPDLQKLDKMRAEVERWASTGYLEALAKGDRLTAQEREDAIDHLSRYTRIQQNTYIDREQLARGQITFHPGSFPQSAKDHWPAGQPVRRDRPLRRK